MKKDRRTWIFLVFFLLVVPLLFLLVFGRALAVSEGKAAGAICGFGVDSEESIYVATEKKIKVYRNGELIRMFDPPPNRAYAMVLDGDRLLIGTSTGGEARAFDLEGHELSVTEYSYSDIKKQVKHTAFVNGHEYRLRMSFGRSPYSATCDGETVLQAEPTFFEGLTYWGSLALLTLIFIAFVFYFLAKTRKD